MPLTDHIAILAQSALAAPVPNKKKAGNPLQYYALIAFPPAAFNDINAMLQECAARQHINVNPGMNMGLSVNAQSRKPLPGIGADWFVMRCSSKFPPEVFTAQGVQLLQGDATQSQQIRQSFFAGKKIRAMVSAWSWNNDGEIGFSWNLHAVMDAGEGGERIPGIGGPNAAAEFKQFAKPATPQGSGVPASQQIAGGFGHAGAPVQQARPQPQPLIPAANPFAPAAAQPNVATQLSNPFAQGAQAANPFATQPVQHPDIPY